MKLTRRLAGVTAAAALMVLGESKAAEWQPLESTNTAEQISQPSDQDGLRWSPVNDATSSSPEKVTWTELPADDTDGTDSRRVKWTPVEPGIAAEIEANIENELPVEFPSGKSVVIQKPVLPSGPTFANDKAIWRDEQWHPQISGTVPVGFGPKGFMISGSLWAIDCVTGAGYCSTPTSWEDYLDQWERTGEAQYNISFGFGDAEKLFGLTMTGRFEETSLSLGDRNANETKNIFSNYYLGLHLSRNIGQDTAIKLGIDNWIDVRDCDFCGFPKNAYAVVSQRFRINKDQNSFFPNAYLTLGMGNGQFRPLDELIRASVAEQRKAGCITAGFTPDKPCSQEALQRATWKANSYGKFEPIGALAIETFSGLNLIGEWTGRNLNAGFSLKPFEEFGLIITSMWENILPNCDWGCTVKGIPDYPEGIDLNLLPQALTERPRFSFQISFEMKF